MPQTNLPFLPASGDIANGAPFYYTAATSISQNDVLNAPQSALAAWGEGVIKRPDTALLVSAGTGLNVNITAGIAFVNHRIIES